MACNKNRRDTIQFNRKTTDYTQETVLGCDLGDHLGISVIANNQEIYSGESYCNGNETHQKMQKRKMYRRTRRNRLRHRQARFNNRKKSGYAPSINRKLQFQIKEIQRLTKFLPISKMIFEGSIFDINKLTHHTQQQKGQTLFDFLYARDQTERLNYTVYRTKVSNNNRSLERFYDATYLDLRDGKKKKGAILSSGRTGRSRSKDYDNQRIYRANKIRKGRRSICTIHYFIQVHDLVKYNNHIFSSRGIQNHGLYVRLLARPKDKVVSIRKITCVKHVNGLITEIK